MTKFEQIFCHLLVESENTYSSGIYFDHRGETNRAAHRTLGFACCWVRSSTLSPTNVHMHAYAIYSMRYTHHVFLLCVLAKRAPPPKPNPAQRKATGRKRREQNQGRSPGISHRVQFLRHDLE